MTRTDMTRSPTPNYYEHLLQQRDLFDPKKHYRRDLSYRIDHLSIDTDLVFQAIDKLVKEYEERWTKIFDLICMTDIAGIHKANRVSGRSMIAELRSELEQNPSLSKYFDSRWSDPPLSDWRKILDHKEKELNTNENTA